jgi:hypothetical protein
MALAVLEERAAHIPYASGYESGFVSSFASDARETGGR